MQPLIRLIIVVIACGFTATASHAQVLGDPPDVSQDFQKLENVYFIGSRVTSFDTATAQGNLQWDRYWRNSSLSFNKVDLQLSRGRATEFPTTEYDQDPVLPFAISFVSPRTIRLRVSTRAVPLADAQSLMLAGAVPKDSSWRVEQNDREIVYTGAHGRVRINKQPWRVEIYDARGRLLTRTQNFGEPATYFATVPFSFVRRSNDLARRIAATFELQHDEKIFGCGESFTRFDKRGQRLLVSTRDGMGTQNEWMYKPVPFFLSNNGYGMFVHTSAPLTFDFGKTYDAHNTIYSGDENLDLFVFLGDPKEIVSEYTALTGRSPVPPLWSFGFWMSRVTYNSDQQVREVARQLRAHQIPTDVIHIDTGWFETEGRSDYRFTLTRFPDPAKLMADMKQQGFRITLWQLPYLTSKNELWKEVVAKGYHVKNDGGRLPSEDVTLDLSNPEAVKWYQDKLRDVLKLGVGAIKVDFGEQAPLTGQYASGLSGWYEHNLYPLRYNKAVADVTKETTGEDIIWARSAWAGSQRYPVYWGGDAENNDSAMAGSLRGGLSLGLSGFTYWSHDVGGFVNRPPRDLYRRWLAWGVLSSHTRAHGIPPREPWEFDAALTDDFRRALNLRYSLMPYIYAQAKESSARGFPMLRPLFFEYPNDPGSWTIDNQYLFGSDLLVAPMFTNGDRRRVYLPPGAWIDYQSGRVYQGAGWHEIPAGQIPVVLLVRNHSVLPHLKVAQSTKNMDWDNVELRVFSTDNAEVKGLFTRPGGDVQTLSLVPRGGSFVFAQDPQAGRVKWTIRKMNEQETSPK
jgi:alpha-D-xyloside xylohydrolase